jgi:hypothetical protein
MGLTFQPVAVAVFLELCFADDCAPTDESRVTGVCQLELSVATSPALRCGPAGTGDREFLGCNE